MNNLLKIYKLLSPEPLKGEGLDQYYINLKEGRGNNPTARIKRHLLENPRGNEQILFSGYRGCGKSTELNKLQQEIEDRFIVINYSVMKELDPISLNYTELIMITMEKLFEAVRDKNILIDEAMLKAIWAWKETAEVKKVEDFSSSVLVDIGAKISVPWFINFFANLRGSANASYNNKVTITQAIEHRLKDLINLCNDLIREIKLKLPDKGLLIIIEDLDKLSVAKAEELFFNNVHTLISLRANVIFTFPIALQIHPLANVIKSNFKDYSLPMVKVKTKEGQPFEEGREVLKEIILKRMSIASFETEDILYQFIDTSGGCLRDLFRMIRDGADYALDDERDIINQADYTKSVNRLKRNYKDTIAEKRDAQNKLVISIEEYLKVLVDAANSPDKQINNTAAAMDLRQSLCLLEYNGDTWCDVHPVVKQILVERGLITANATN